MQETILSLLTNHWVVTLFVSPIVGVLWAKMLSKRHQSQTRARELYIKQQQKADINGDGNHVNQTQTVNNTKHIYYGDNQRQNSDGGAEAIAVAVIPKVLQ